jgi:GntR family transcriptional repressor for pyruvate dehydrogenase complex
MAPSGNGSRPRASGYAGVADRLASSLRKSILGGRLRHGDPLPSERELAERYLVNRSSVREAMKRLEGWGLVKIRHGGATRVSDFLLSAGLDLLPYLVEVDGPVDPSVLRELHEIRAMLLGWCAEQAALKADAASVARLEALSRRLTDSRGRPTEAQELDYDFFEALVQITGNRPLMLVSNVVRDVYLRGRKRFLGLYAKDAFDPAHHQRAVEAIRARDAAAAGAAMRAHAQMALDASGGEP